MKEITIGGKKIKVGGTPLALFFYRQEFNADLIGDFTAQQEAKDDITKFDSVQVLQMIWAMNKTTNPTNFPDFYSWLTSLESFDIGDEKMMTAVVEEIENGFFRGGKNQQQSGGRGAGTRKN